MENEQSLTKKDDFLPYLLFDKLDDDLIIKELEGKLPGILTYHFKDKTGLEIWGLSKSGVDEATAELARSRGEVIRELEIKFEDRENDAFFTVKAGRFGVKSDGTEILLDVKFGFKKQSKKHPSGSENFFWFEQGGIKACRNACFRLIPKTVTQAIIEFAKKEGKVKDVKPEDLPKENGKTKNFQWLDSMKKAKARIGKERYYEILTGEWNYEHADIVTDSKEQTEIIEEMREVFRKDIKDKK